MTNRASATTEEEVGRKYNRKVVIPAKQNDDGSYSVRLPARQLVDIAFVDFYDEKTGAGYQRKEPLRERRGREIADYIARCVESGTHPHLFEMTANARYQREDVENAPGLADAKFEALDDSGTIGHVILRVRGSQWLSMIDGGTRLLGVTMALESGVFDPDTPLDVRMYVGLSVAEEIAAFLLINEKQKKVRTDLGIRVVQRQLDEGDLDEEELALLQTVVPDTDQWRYEASRIVSHLNSDRGSPWAGRIQQPNEPVTRPIKLQAFFTSLRNLLNDEELSDRLESLEREGLLNVEGKAVDRTGFLLKVLKNFWSAVADIDRMANEEPQTSVLWGSIGATACHLALVPVLNTMLAQAEPDFSKETFRAIIENSMLSDYGFWYTRAGRKADEAYPDRKGEAVKYIGASGYARLAKMLEREFKRSIRQSISTAVKA